MTSAGPQPTNPERWHRVKEVLNAALDLQPSEREEFLQKACGADTELRTEVAELLASYEEAGDDFLDRPDRDLPAFDPFTKTNDLLVGKHVGPYKIVEEIGHGGMGSVYKAVRADDLYKRDVAIKIVRRGMNNDFIVRRFRHERQALAALDHPNVARLLDGGATEDGLPYFVMEYIDGMPIDAYCDEHRVDTEERLRMFQQVCGGVQAAHDRKIVHRDIKPANILVDAYGRPKLLDFGIAKILDPELSTQNLDPTATVLRLMTPEYASPEQVCGEEVTATSDVYSLGVLLYELLTGHRPYRLKRRSAHEIAQVILDTEPERPSTVVSRTEVVTRGSNPAVTVTPESVSVARKSRPEELRRKLSGDLDNIILMAMRKEANRRYRCAADLSDDIQRYLDGLPIAARKDTLFYRVSKNMRRNRKLLLVGSLAMFVGTGVVIGWDYLRPNLRTEMIPTNITPLTSYPGDETQPAFSPDGQKVAFVWAGENNENSDIYIRDLNNGSLFRLTTNPAIDLSPVWSPQAKRLAFLRIGPNATEVFSSPATGGLHAVITSLFPTRIEAVGRHLDWSPDGRYLVAADKKSPDEAFSIVLIEATTGHKIQITSPPSAIIGDTGPAFSPDGKSVAFIRAQSSGVDDIYVVGIGGGDVRRITSDRRYIISLSWTPDGKWILFSSNRQGTQNLYRVGVDGEPIERLAGIGEGVSDPVMTRDGRKMAFSQFYIDTNIWQLDLATGKRRKFIASTQQDTSPTYSPDGQRIAFRSNRSGYNEIWTASASNPADATQLTHFEGSLTGSPHWAPDSKRVACDARPDGPPDIYVVDTETKVAKRITTDPAEDVVPRWSHDGKWVYFVSTRNGSTQIWKAPADGGEAQQVTKQGGFAPMESTDARYVYYAKGRTVSGLWRVSLEDGLEEPVMPKLKPGYWGYWSLCGGGVYFVDKDVAGPPTLFEFDLTTVALRPLHQFDKPVVVGDSAFSMSPDCRTALWTQRDQSGSDIMVSNYNPKK